MTRDQILAMLALRGPQTVEQLQQVLGFTYDKTHNSLARLQKAKKVFRLADKRYAHAAQVALVNGQPQLIGSAKTTTPPPVPAAAKKTLVFGALNNPTVITPAPAGHIVNRYVVLYDRSGSMGVHAVRAKETVNKILTDIRNAAAQFNQTTEVSLYQFNTDVQELFHRRQAHLVEQVYQYYPQGNTALYDAVGRAIKEHLIPEQPDENVSTVILVVTDGEENWSRTYSAEKLAELIREVQKTDRWTVTFQVPPGYKRALCQRLGVPEGNVREWEQTDRGFQEAAVASNMATLDFMSARSAGATKSTSYYVRTDLSQVTQGDLNKLTNIAGQVKVWRVEKEQDVESFIESKLGAGAYVRGTAFYELTKPEKVQSYKKVVVMKKDDKNQVFGGNQARGLLGLPSGVDAKVTPGNHANFDVFNQSTSNNRILVRGSKLVYWPGALNS